MPTTFFNENPDQFALWQKIEAFDFDVPGTHFTFQEKLARNNEWTLSYAGTVITEYKKFIFLCCVSPTGASPSKAVDEAWHLHLTYTKSYWVELCKNILGFELHHYPSTGGEKEDLKHAKWYAETLVLYSKIFEATPPIGVWPPATKAPDAEFMEAVKVSPGKKQYGRAAIILLTPFVFSVIFFQTVNPFALTGNQFVVFFFLLCMAAVGAYNYLRDYQSSQIIKYVSQHFPSNPSLSQMGSYTTDNTRLVQTAVLDLIRKGVLEINGKQNLRVCKANLHTAADNPMYWAIAEVEDGYKASTREIVKTWFNREHFLDHELEALKYNIEESYEPASWIFISVLILGGLRFLQGMISGYSVIWLVTEMLVFGAVFFFSWARDRIAVLTKQATQRHLGERLQAQDEWDKDVLTQFAVQGTDSLRHFTNAAIVTGLMISLSSFEGRSENGVDGGGGCGGAGGCSGGGGGGGGCGGCGGCGGGCGGG